MSPEQEAGGDIDSRSDIFAFGAVMYECLIGSPPPPRKPSDWPSSSRNGGRAEGPPTPESGVHAAARSLPDAWQAFIARAMAPEPRDRFPDARTLQHALRELDPTHVHDVAHEPQPAGTKL
jgi:serine/threonine-protein kinase